MFYRTIDDVNNSTTLPEEIKVFYRELLDSPKHTLMSMYGSEETSSVNLGEKSSKDIADSCVRDHMSTDVSSSNNTPAQSSTDVSNVDTTTSAEADINNTDQEFKLPSKLKYKLSPMTRYILDHPFAEREDLDCEEFNSLILKHVVDRTPEGITPLMVAIIINNEAYFERLFRFNIFLQDRFATSNLEFAYLSNASEKIIKTLEFYERWHEWSPRRY